MTTGSADNLGFILEMNDKLEEVEALFEAAIGWLEDIGGIDPNPLGNLGWVYYKRGQLEQAEKQFRRAWEQSRYVSAGQDNRYGADLGMVLTDLGRIDEAMAVLREKTKRPSLRQRDRIFWAILSRIWGNWRSALLIVQPDTVIRWHRRSFKIFGRWKSRSRRGRPSIEPEIRKLIRRMSRENPICGTPRIQSELALLGYIVADSTIDKY